MKSPRRHNEIDLEESLPNHSQAYVNSPLKININNNKRELVKNANPYEDIYSNLNIDSNILNKLKILYDKKKIAIANENYLEAKKIKTIEQEFLVYGNKLNELEKIKAKALADEDYDLANEIKEEIYAIKDEIEEKMELKFNEFQLNIPGINNNQSFQASSYLSPKKNYDNDEKASGLSPRLGPYHSPNDPVIIHGETPRNQISMNSPSHYSPTSHSHANAFRDNYDNEVDRPIRPKNNEYYNDQDPDQENYEEKILNTDQPKEDFPQGEHPLEGIPQYSDLPTPEPLSLLSRDYCEQTGLIKVLGEYLSRCLFSKVWLLRDAAIMKVYKTYSVKFIKGNEKRDNDDKDSKKIDDVDNDFKKDISEESKSDSKEESKEQTKADSKEEEDPKKLFESLLPVFCTILKLGSEDKTQQVSATTFSLLSLVLLSIKKYSVSMSKQNLTTIFDPILIQLVLKLADGNQRLREISRKSLQIIADCSKIGPAYVASHLSRALPPKQKTNWRPIAMRLIILTSLANDHEINSSHSSSPFGSLQLDHLLSFPKMTSAFTHSSREVREAAKELIVAIQKQVGSPPLEPILSLLRKAQRDDYEASFTNHTPSNSSQVDYSPIKPSPKKVPTSSNKIQEGSPAHINHSASKSQENHPDDAENEEDFTTCLFCQEYNPEWNESARDLHFWQDCPFLISCPSCTQVVEIASLPEHLLDECKKAENYIPCEVTGLAIHKDEYEAWKNGPHFIAAPEGCLYCPLCFSSVQDSDEAWTNHLSKECTKNPRIKR